MERQPYLERALYRAANGLVLACAGLFLPFFGVGAVTWKHILVLVSVLAFLVGTSLLSARGKSLCLLLLAVCLCVPAAVAGLRASGAFLGAYLQWCSGSLDGQEQWKAVFPLLHTAVITTGAFLIQIILEKAAALRICLAGICGGGLLFCLFAQISMTHMGTVFLLLFIVMVLTELLQKRWKKKKSGGPKAQMVWIYPFLCVYLLLMAVMPAPEKPYDWKWARNLYSQVKESFLEVASRLFYGGWEDFDLSLSGFSESGELGGKVRENTRKVMHIQSQRSLLTNVYLTGKIYDTFDGRQWLQEYEGEEKERFLDTMETLYAVRRLDGKYLTDYLWSSVIRIRYDSFHTEYVFAPLKTGSLQGSDRDLEYSFRGPDLVFEKRKRYGTEYDVRYYQINMGEELFERLLEAPLDREEELWGSIAGEYSGRIGQVITLEQMDARRQRIHEDYLAPAGLSKKAEAYLLEVTKDAETDLEKLRSIERELRSFTYNRQPGPLPEEVVDAGSFLDHFLLESRQGYCVYFATAFVLLARAEGFPARYVQGYCVPMKGSREADVLASMAHSWPEVYFDGVGWIPFEPTPGYENLRYTPWRAVNRDSLDPSAEEKGPEELEESPLETEEAEWDEASEDRDEEKDAGFAKLWRMLLLGIPAALAATALVLFADELIGRYRYRRMDLTGKLKTEVRNSLKVLGWLGLRREEPETLQELGERAALTPGLEDLRFIREYEDVLYGGRIVDEGMLERVKRERERLWSLLRSEKKSGYGYYRLRMFLTRYR